MARRSLVVGGRRGIGAAVVRALLARGDAVTFTYRTDAGDLDALRAAYPDAMIETTMLDLADRAAVDGFAEGLEAAAAYDVLVQVGGTTYDALAAMMDQSQAERAMQVNYFAFARVARAVVRPMMRARHGRIVAIGSIIGGMTASQGNAAYAATKAALLAYVRTLAIESAKRGITVNYIAPGLVDTEMMAPFAAYRAAVEARVPVGRFATPDEVAAVAAFLTTPEAGYVNGAVIPVDGGLTAGVGLPRS
jgi:3-oxoacyl-[acyl-carrier protein] reductase